MNLPQFTETSTIAIVNLDTLECQPVTFTTSDGASKADGDDKENDKSGAKVEDDGEDLIPDDDSAGEL